MSYQGLLIILLRSCMCERVAWHFTYLRLHTFSRIARKMIQSLRQCGLNVYGLFKSKSILCEVFSYRVMNIIFERNYHFMWNSLIIKKRGLQKRWNTVQHPGFFGTPSLSGSHHKYLKQDMWRNESPWLIITKYVAVHSCK